MAKIKVTSPVVQFAGDEMIRIMRGSGRSKPVLPYLDPDLKYYNLGMESHDALAPVR
jgi:isocitrate dehydrogenase